MDPAGSAPMPGDYTHAKAIDVQRMYQGGCRGKPGGGPPDHKTRFTKPWRKGAQSGDHGWEQARYFLADGSAEDYSFRRSSAFGPVGEKQRGPQPGGGADPDRRHQAGSDRPTAAALLDCLAANRLPSQPGGIRLAHMLTTLGGIEGEVTITRLGDDRFYLNSSIMAEQHDQDWLRQHVLGGGEVTVTDVTNQRGILAVTGPRSRELLGKSPAPTSHHGFPWLTGRRS